MNSQFILFHITIQRMCLLLQLTTDVKTFVRSVKLQNWVRKFHTNINHTNRKSKASVNQSKYKTVQALPQLPDWCMTICNAVSVTKNNSLIRCVPLRRKYEKNEMTETTATQIMTTETSCSSIFISNTMRSTFFLPRSFSIRSAYVRTLLLLSLTFANSTLKQPKNHL